MVDPLFIDQHILLLEDMDEELFTDVLFKWIFTVVSLSKGII